MTPRWTLRMVSFDSAAETHGKGKGLDTAAKTHGKGKGKWKGKGTGR